MIHNLECFLFIFFCLGYLKSCLQGINLNSQPVRNKKKQRKHMPKKIITRTRKYLRGSAIYLRPRSYRDFTIIRKITKCGYSIFLTLKKHDNQQNPNNQIAFSTQNGPKKFSRGRCPRTPRRFVHECFSLGLSTQAFAPQTKSQ